MSEERRKRISKQERILANQSESQTRKVYKHLLNVSAPSNSLSYSSFRDHTPFLGEHSFGFQCMKIFLKYQFSNLGEKLILSYMLVLLRGRKVAPKINHKNLTETKGGCGVSVLEVLCCISGTLQYFEFHLPTAQEKKAILVPPFSLSFHSNRQTKTK